MAKSTINHHFQSQNHWMLGFSPTFLNHAQSPILRKMRSLGSAIYRPSKNVKNDASPDLGGNPKVSCPRNLVVCHHFSKLTLFNLWDLPPPKLRAVSRMSSLAAWPQEGTSPRAIHGLLRGWQNGHPAPTWQLT